MRLLVLSLFSLALLGADESPPTLSLRSPAPAFSLPGIDGKTHNLYDGETQAVSRAYGPKATPHVFIFDAARTLRYEGRIDNNQRESLVKTQDARNAIDALLAGNPAPLDHTGVFGCSTKWKSKSSGRIAEMKKIEAEPVTVQPVTAAGLRDLRRNLPDADYLGQRAWWATK